VIWRADGRLRFFLREGGPRQQDEQKCAEQQAEEGAQVRLHRWNFIILRIRSQPLFIQGGGFLSWENRWGFSEGRNDAASA